jgi:cytochrome oxidase assembly protein ShyY1
VYVLKGEELVTPPWVTGKLEDWLYRPVQVTGRPNHSKEMKFPVKRLNFEGRSLFVPVITEEDEESSYGSRKGLIVGLGWIPKSVDSPASRGRWENFLDTQNYVGYVTTNEELQNGTGGNIYDEQLFDFSKSLT